MSQMINPMKYFKAVHAEIGLTCRTTITWLQAPLNFLSPSHLPLDVDLNAQMWSWHWGMEFDFSFLELVQENDQLLYHAKNKVLLWQGTESCWWIAHTSVIFQQRYDNMLISCQSSSSKVSRKFSGLVCMLFLLPQWMCSGCTPLIDCKFGDSGNTSWKC